MTQQLVSQQSRQGSLDGLLKLLQNLPPSDQTSSDLRAAVDKLLAGLPDVQQLSTPKGLAQALASSGAVPRSETAQRAEPDAGAGHERRSAQADRTTDAGPAGQHQSQRDHCRQHPGPGHAEFRAQRPRHARPGQRQTVSRPVSRCPSACCKARTAKTISNTCCVWPQQRFRACKAISCRAWNRPASPTTGG